MRTRRLLCSLVVVMIAGLVIMSCGGGSSSGTNGVSTMTVTTSTNTGNSGGVSTATYTEGTFNNAGLLDPSISADCYPTTPRTDITMCSDNAGVLGARS